MADVRYLADDALGGRGATSPGARCAARFVAARFDSLGLEPAGPGASFFQPFDLRVGSVLGEDNEFTVAGVDAELGRSWSPLGFSSSGRVSGELVYAGSGVARPDRPRGDLGDVTGHIAVVEAPTPGARGAYSDLHFKATVAAGRGAVGVVILLRDGAPLPDPARERRPSVDVPAAVVAGEAAERVRAAARRGERATLATEVRPVTAEARNVMALLPGADSLWADEVVVVGAHYDHLGLGGAGSVAAAMGEIHNGADDNASGTAALLEVAERLVTGPRPARSVLFLAFSAEESGLLGSDHYVDHPVVPLERTVAMVNMDMVGRLREGGLVVYGMDTAEEWSELVLRAGRPLLDLSTLSLRSEGFGPSDHAAFWREGVPVLHFFTNTHGDYHRPSDDWQKVDAEGIETVAAVVTAVTRRLAGGGDREAVALTPGTPGENPYTTVRATPEPRSGDPGTEPAPAEAGPRSGRGYGPYLGTIPDMGAMAGTEGVPLTGVREDSPAERAGLQAGDVVVQLGEWKVENLLDYTYALRDHAPGDEVEIVVLRAEERVTTTVVLGERR